MKLKRVVKKRDRNMCQFPGCYGRESFQLHHIRKYADYPTLRFDENNVILLCKKCHKIVRGNEERYAPIFLRIVQKNKDAQVRNSKR